MPRVAMITHSYYLRDPRVRREAESLAAAGHHVDVISLRRPGEPLRQVVSGVSILRLPFTHERAGKVRYAFEYGAGLVLAFWWLTALAVRHRYDVVQVHTPPDLLVFAAIVPRLMGARILLDLHDPMPEAMLTKFDQGWDHWLVRLVRWQERISIAFAHHVITVTDQVRQTLVERGVPADKIDIVMNFADNRLFESRDTQRVPAAGTPGPIIVFMGTLAYRYGMDVAITALPMVLKQEPNARIRVIGDGEERPRLEAQAAQLGVADRVEFVGQVPIDRIPDVALPADVGIAPHRRDRLYDMCFPSKIYDYLALGVPVAAAWTESLHHYYGDDTLRLFESGDAAGLADAIVSLYRSPECAAAQRARGRAFVDSHNWRTESARYRGIVEGLARA